MNSCVVRLLWLQSFALVLLTSQTSMAVNDFLDFSVYVSVVDEKGNALSDAEVSLDAYLPTRERKGGRRFREYLQQSNTDAPLLFEGKCLGRVIIRVNNEGYYTSWQERRLTVDYAAGRYEPWGEVLTIVLKEQTNPRPLYVHRVDWLDVPNFDEPIGFDLEKADWVAPHGAGVHSDFIFTLSRSLGTGEVFNGKMQLAFSEPMDGVFLVDSQQDVNSTLLLGRKAPLEGYQPAYERSVGVAEIDGVLKLIDDPTRETLDGYEGFWFRVRSEVDETTGELKQARYGKIDGFFDFAVRREQKPGRLRFVYYFSPDESRSLEFNGESLVENADLQGVKKR